ncbi:MAG: T9SS type A sorting domain-containing protein, partial [Leadbetterella sp.]
LYKVKLGEIKVELFKNNNYYSFRDCSNYSPNIYASVDGLDYSLPYNFEYFRNNQLIQNFQVTGNELKEQIFTQSGDYKVKVKNGTCEATSDVYKYQMPFIPEVNFSNPSDICNGKPTILSTKVDANTKIFWEKDLVMLTTNSDKLAVDKVGNYKVYLKTPNCIQTSDLVSVGKIDLPNTINLVGDSIYCPNKSVLLSGDFIPNATYEYLQNDKTIFKSTKNEFSTFDKGDFKIKYLKSSCSNTSKAIRLSHLVNVDLNASDTSYCKGGGVTLTGVSNTQYRYKWFKNAVEIADATSNTYRVNTPGLYNLNVLNSTCEGISKKFNIIEKPTLKADISGEGVVDYGDSTYLKFKFESTPPYTLKLNNDQVFTLNTNPAEIKIKPLKTFEYKIESVSNICGAGQVSGSAKIQVLVLGSEPLKSVYWNIYPNPSFEGVYVSCKNQSAIKNLQLKVLNSKGEVLMSKRNLDLDQDQYIDLKGLPTGVYIFYVNGKDISQSFKVIKQ